MQDEPINLALGERTHPLSPGERLLQNSLKQHLAILLLTLVYMLGADFLLYRVSHLHPELEFYPLSTILLYISLFYVPACLGLLAVVLLYFIVYSLKNYQDRPFWRNFRGRFRNQFLTRQQLNGILFTFFLIPLFFAFAGMYKQMLPFVNPFSWDQTFMHWDYVLHFHHHPWELLQPLVGYPWLTQLLGKVYGTWFSVLAGLILWQAITKERFYRMQFFLTFFLCWMILGTLMAYYFSSAGPCFYGFFSHDTQNPYTPLLSYLSQNGPPWVHELQEFLLDRLLSGSLIFGGGVSAMPSMHISIATLSFLICSKHNRWLGLLAFVYLILIQVACIHLAWHYAVDGYVAMTATALIWYAVGRVLANMNGSQREARFPARGEI